MMIFNLFLENMFECMFKLSENKISFCIEFFVGVIIFLIMCYIIIVNLMILFEMGMDYGVVFVVICFVVVIGCLVMGIVVNYLIVLVLGMGLNVYFIYLVCMGMGVFW